MASHSSIPRRRHHVRHLRGLARRELCSAYALSNRLFFRSGAAPSAFGAFVDTAAQGFYFDDLFYSVANQSAPATALAAYATGFEPPAIPAPDLTISKSHVGNFTQGQIGAQFTVTVTNSGTPSTIGVVTLTDVVPAGLTPTAASGAGWTCTVAGATVTCTRSDALAPGASYPPVTITVNVAANAPASVTNTATISGGGDVNATNNAATDVATILPGPDLIVSKSHVGNFTQGQTGATYTIVRPTRRRADQRRRQLDRHCPGGPHTNGGQRCWLDLHRRRRNGHLHSKRRPGPGSELPAHHAHGECRSRRPCFGD